MTEDNSFKFTWLYVGRRLRRKRQFDGYTPRQATQGWNLPIDESTLSAVERGEPIISFQTLRDVCTQAGLWHLLPGIPKSGGVDLVFLKPSAEHHQVPLPVNWNEVKELQFTIRANLKAIGCLLRHSRERCCWSREDLVSQVAGWDCSLWLSVFELRCIEDGDEDLLTPEVLWALCEYLPVKFFELVPSSWLESKTSIPFLQATG